MCVDARIIELTYSGRESFWSGGRHRKTRRGRSDRPKRPVGRPDAARQTWLAYYGPALVGARRRRSQRRQWVASTSGESRDYSDWKIEGFSPSTNRAVFAWLVKEGVLEVQRGLKDGRQRIYRLRMNAKDFKAWLAKWENRAAVQNHVDEDDCARNSSPLYPLGGSPTPSEHKTHCGHLPLPQSGGPEPALLASKKLPGMADDGKDVVLTVLGCSTILSQVLGRGSMENYQRRTVIILCNSDREQSPKSSQLPMTRKAYAMSEKLAQTHWDTCKVGFAKHTVRAFAERSLAQWFDENEIIAAYRAAVQYCHELNKFKLGASSPGLIVHLAEKRLHSKPSTASQRRAVIVERQKLEAWANADTPDQQAERLHDLEMFRQLNQVLLSDKAVQQNRR